MKSFEEHIKEGIAKKISPNLQRAESFCIEAERKYNLLQETTKTMGINDNNANDYVEYCYNILMFLIRAKMIAKGYASSGEGAHEAEVAFAGSTDLSEQETQFLDKMRYFRNGILYYGKRFDKEYAEKVIAFTKKLYQKLR